MTHTIMIEEIIKIGTDQIAEKGEFNLWTKYRQTMVQTKL